MHYQNTDTFTNAIYEAYFTGKVGTSFALLLFRDGVIAGTDSGDGIYDGDYAITSDQQHIVYGLSTFGTRSRVPA